MKYPNLSHEKELRNSGYQNIAGIDEAGRGAWAGPVVAATVVLPGGFVCDLLRDSKLLSAKRRDEIYEQLVSEVDYGVGIIDNNIIDQINILEATKLAMKKAISDLDSIADFVLIDAVELSELNCEQLAVIKGDQKIMSIAAASIIAKVTRDRILTKMHVDDNRYCYDQHKGYGTKLHSERLDLHGVSEFHRLSYKPIKKKLSRI